MRLARQTLAQAALVLVWILAAVPTAAAQARDQASVSARFDPSGDPLIITLKATPGVAYLTQDVHLTGGTIGLGQVSSVNIVVTPPYNAGEKPKPTTLVAA